MACRWKDVAVLLVTKAAPEVHIPERCKLEQGDNLNELCRYREVKGFEVGVKLIR